MKILKNKTNLTQLHYLNASDWLNGANNVNFLGFLSLTLGIVSIFYIFWYRLCLTSVFSNSLIPNIVRQKSIALIHSTLHNQQFGAKLFSYSLGQQIVKQKPNF